MSPAPQGRIIAWRTTLIKKTWGGWPVEVISCTNHQLTTRTAECGVLSLDVPNGALLRRRVSQGPANMFRIPCRRAHRCPGILVWRALTGCPSFRPTIDLGRPEAVSINSACFKGAISLISHTGVHLPSTLRLLCVASTQEGKVYAATHYRTVWIAGSEFLISRVLQMVSLPGTTTLSYMPVTLIRKPVTEPLTSTCRPSIYSTQKLCGSSME